ncbi:hypothetical protein [Thiothrix lacustris]|uniref:hypothetical protein n=1 Tax=Thiothrix lacustris TaxID=525917 RepID=UPI0027E43ED3|nr:hypothetical protein [Thiothrix lacustris]WMP15856.1 hypothetical protein RCS87_10655 [Thiothrix lacustris]
MSEIDFSKFTNYLFIDVSSVNIGSSSLGGQWISLSGHLNNKIIKDEKEISHIITIHIKEVENYSEVQQTLKGIGILYYNKDENTLNVDIFSDQKILNSFMSRLDRQNPTSISLDVYADFDHLNAWDDDDDFHEYAWGKSKDGDNKLIIKDISIIEKILPILPQLEKEKKEEVFPLGNISLITENIEHIKQDLISKATVINEILKEEKSLRKDVAFIGLLVLASTGLYIFKTFFS